MSWVVGMISNAVIATAYFSIVAAIVVPLTRSRQLRSNPLGAATASIFFTCAVHHGIHSVHMLLPSLGIDDPNGLAMRAAWSWPLATWDIVGAAVGIWYWSLRRGYSSLMQGAKLFEDLRQREQQALEINDSVLQGLVTAKLALDLDQPAKARAALDTAIDSTSRMITDLLGDQHLATMLRRGNPALDDEAQAPAPALPGSGRPRRAGGRGATP